MAFANKTTGSSLKKFDLIVDGQTNSTTTAYSVNTYLKGLAGGTHTLVVRSEFLNGFVDSDTLSITVNAPTSIKDQQVGHNAASCIQTENGLTINLASGILSSVEIYSLQGQRLYQAKPMQSNLPIRSSELPSGILLVRARNEKGETSILKIRN
jgi:hypothetical protein